jgi:hypothetical protein
MSGTGPEQNRTRRLDIGDAAAARRRAQLVSGLRGRAMGGEPGRAARLHGRATEDPVQRDPDLEYCDLCGLSIGAEHRHLLQLTERRIVCSCEACWAMRAGEGDYRPVGNRTLWLEDLDLPDDVWAGFQVPIGLAFFMYSTVTACIVAMYPSPAGATESELHFESWVRMCELNPVLAQLEPDVEGLIVNRLVDPPVYAIAPIDRCYALTGAIKVAWEGIAGGTGVDRTVTRFFDELRAGTVAA